MDQQTPQLLPIHQLHEWVHNPRNITVDQFEKLKERLSTMDQIKPLLVTPDGDESYSVIGGNMRLRALRELAEDTPDFQVWVLVIDFVRHEEDGMFRAVIGGRESVKRFASKEDGMMEYALLDNERSGYYDAESLANIEGEFNIDWDYTVDFREAQNIETMLNKYASEPSDTVVAETGENTGSDAVEQTSDRETSEQPTTVEEVGESNETPTSSLPSDSPDGMLVECPDCRCVFDARKHRTQKNESTTIDSLSDLIR